MTAWASGRNPSKGSEQIRISVLSQMDPASPRTNSIADLRLCSGLAANGIPVELVVPGIARQRPPAESLISGYGLEPNFDIRFLPMPRENARLHDSRIFLPLVRRHLLGAARMKRPPVVVSRGIRLVLPYIALSGLRRGLVTAPWLHEFRGKRLERLVCASSTCVLATNSAILRDLASALGSTPRSFATGNPVPAERAEFGRTCSRAEARQQIGLDQEQTVIVYTGKLYLGMRELEHLLTAAGHMPDCLFLLTGGRPPVIEELTRQLRERAIANVRLVGMLSRPEETRFYQQAADVLVSYYSTDDHPYAHHNLPGKLVEYMVTGNPIVSADFPAVRDLLNPENAILVRPDDGPALVEGLSFAVENRDRAAALGARARRDASSRTTESLGAELGAFLAGLANRRV